MQIHDQQLILNVEIPVNTTATIYIPVTGINEVMENGQPLTASKNLQVVNREREYVVVKVGSGRYEFSTPYSIK